MDNGTESNNGSGLRRGKANTLEPILFLAVLVAVFAVFSSVMGLGNFINTMMNTAYSLLVDTVLYLTAIAVLSGALSSLLSEFGVVSLLNRLISPLMRFIYGLPGAGVLAVISSYLSDNPAILPLAGQENFRRYFEPWEIPALTNLGTSFGMGLVVTLYVCGLKGGSGGGGFFLAALVGNLGAIGGSIISVRLMLLLTKKALAVTPAKRETSGDKVWTDRYFRRSGNVGTRFLNAMIDGGKAGVQMGISIVPGVLLICSFVMLLTGGMPEGGYTGAAGEGIALLPWIGSRLSFLLRPLFGFSSSDAIAVPITAIGSGGAAISLIPSLISAGKASAGDVAVFTAMSMCWSGYLSTHTAMMDTLGYPHLTGKAVLAHTVGGAASGVIAHLLYAAVSLLM